MHGSMRRMTRMLSRAGAVRGLVMYINGDGDRELPKRAQSELQAVPCLLYPYQHWIEKVLIQGDAMKTLEKKYQAILGR